MINKYFYINQFLFFWFFWFFIQKSHQSSCISNASSIIPSSVLAHNVVIDLVDDTLKPNIRVLRFATHKDLGKQTAVSWHDLSMTSTAQAGVFHVSTFLAIACSADVVDANASKSAERDESIRRLENIRNVRSVRSVRIDKIATRLVSIQTWRTRQEKIGHDATAFTTTNNRQLIHRHNSTTIAHLLQLLFS